MKSRRRHPLGCCFSNFKQYYARGQHFSYSLVDIGRFYRDYVDLMAHFEGRGAKLYLPRGDRDYAFDVGLRMLELRHLVEEPEEGLFAAVATERPVLAYYANAIAHLR